MPEEPTPTIMEELPVALLATRIQSVRVRLGLSGAELARKIGVDQSAVSEVQRGRRRPSAEFLYGLASLGVRLDKLLYFPEDTRKSPTTDEILATGEVVTHKVEEVDVAGIAQAIVKSPPLLSAVLEAAKLYFEYPLDVDRKEGRLRHQLAIIYREGNKTDMGLVEGIFSHILERIAEARRAQDKSA